MDPKNTGNQMSSLCDSHNLYKSTVQKYSSLTHASESKYGVTRLTYASESRHTKERYSVIKKMRPYMLKQWYKISSTYNDFFPMTPE